MNRYEITDVQVMPVRFKDGLVAMASVVFNESFYLGNIGIMTRLDGNGYRLSYPTRMLADGGSRNIYYPINVEAAGLMDAAIFEKMETVMKRRKTGF